MMIAKKGRRVIALATYATVKSGVSESPIRNPDNNGATAPAKLRNTRQSPRVLPVRFSWDPMIVSMNTSRLKRMSGTTMKCIRKKNTAVQTSVAQAIPKSAPTSISVTKSVNRQLPILRKNRDMRYMGTIEMIDPITYRQPTCALERNCSRKDECRYTISDQCRESMSKATQSVLMPCSCFGLKYLNVSEMSLNIVYVYCTKRSPNVLFGSGY